MIVHHHTFHNAEQANAFMCAINWINNIHALNGTEVIFEPIDIGVGTDERDGEMVPVAIAIVNEYEPDDDITEGYIKQYLDHREHV